MGYIKYGIEKNYRLEESERVLLPAWDIRILRFPSRLCIVVGELKVEQNDHMM